MGFRKRSAIAGAAGTYALDAVTYLDIAVRGRAPSRTPDEAAGRLADLAHVGLGTGEPAGNRRTGLGALLGYATGVSVAVGYAVVGGYRLPRPVSALALAVLAVVTSNAPMTVLGVTDPKRWTVGEWVADAVPHLAYGVVAASALPHSASR